MQPKIALAMIVKATDDEAPHLERCLKSVKGHVDGIFLLLNNKAGVAPSKKVMAVAEKYDKNYTVMDWTNFGDMRRLSFEAVTDDYDFIVWLDTDDTVVNPEKLRQIAAATPKATCAIYMAYDYAHDQFGNVTVQHYVARMVRNNGSFAWSDKILHETLEPVRQCDKALSQEVSMYHHADDARREASLYRNIEMLEKELKGEERRTYPDPRTLYYLGTTYIDIGNTEQAKSLLARYLQLSGWAEERAQAWTSLGNMFSEENNVEEARRCYMHGITENPKDPSPYVEMGKIEMLAGMQDKAIVWLEMALRMKPGPLDTTSFSMETEYKAHMYLADSYLSIGGSSLDKAAKEAQKALQMRPDKATQRFYETIVDVIKKRDTTQGVVNVLAELEREKRKDDVVTMINTLPLWMQDNPSILRRKHRNSTTKIWPDNSIVIFAGTSPLGDWGPWSLEDGIGGSEEAVVRLGNELNKLGHQVTVYGSPGKRAGNYDGVEYRNAWELSLLDDFNVFIVWRSPEMFDADIKAKKKYLWLHDVMPKQEFTKERVDNLDKVIVLSKYHRRLFPNIPDDKIFLSANGITPEDFEDIEVERDSHRVIYMSSHVRGLDLLYEAWPAVKKAVPDAKLDVYYGWESYIAVNRGNPERMAWKDAMVQKQKKLKDVEDHGRIGHKQITQEIFKSGVWAYPCPFPEISCITAVKAQAGGAWPVSSDFAALAETVRFGKKIHMKAASELTQVGGWNEKDLKEYTEALIDALKNPPTDQQRDEMMQTVRKEMSWKVVVEQWHGEMK